MQGYDMFFHGYYISVLRFDLHFRIVRASIFG